ncbi:MAG TPA: DHA2 family efflux MFS transporter permease subunit [Streptosporangiaceae bacterium]
MQEVPDGAGKNAARSKWLALVAMGLGVFLIANDFTALSVAIPRIESDLHTTLNRAQWVINGYALVFGVLIVTGGRLADMFGRKRMFMVGATIFGAFSLLAGLMPTAELLIACRALMGAGGAIVWPAVLGLTYMILPANKKGLAGGLILGVAGLGNAVGPLLGGWLTDVSTWRLVFFINLPITALAMIVTAREVPESPRENQHQGIDYPGIAALSAGAVAILVGLDLGADGGFGRPLIVGLLTAGVLLLGAFALVERHQGARALVPAAVLRSHVFAAACTVVLLMSAIFFSALIFLPQFLQKVLGYSALRSGAGLLPMMGTFAVSSFAAGWAYRRVGPKTVVSAGSALLAAGIFWLSWLGPASAYGSLVPGMMVLGAGVGLFYSSVTTAAVTALDPAQASLAGGIVYMCQIAGGAIGLALNTAIVLSATQLTSGISLAFRIDAALAVAGTALALRFIRRPGPNQAARSAPPAHHRVRI